MKRLMLLALVFTACTPSAIGPVTPGAVTFKAGTAVATISNGTKDTLRTVSVRVDGEITDIVGAVKCNPPVDSKTVCLLATTLAPNESRSLFYKGTPSAAFGIYRVGDGPLIVLSSTK